MFIDETLRDILLADAAVEALVEDRIFADANPHDQYPCIVFALISGIAFETLTSTANLHRPRYQVSCWAEDKDAAIDLAEKVKDCLNGFRDLDQSIERISYVGPHSLPVSGDAPQVVGIGLDFMIWHKE